MERIDHSGGLGVWISNLDILMADVFRRSNNVALNVETVLK
jgi:hypothetical protein